MVLVLLLGLHISPSAPFSLQPLQPPYHPFTVTVFQILHQSCLNTLAVKYMMLCDGS